MEIKDIMDVLDPKLKEHKEALAAQAAAAQKATEEMVAELNEDAKKKGDTLEQLKEKVDKVIAKQGKLKAESEAQKTFNEIMSEAIAEKFEDLTKVSKGRSVKLDLKAVGDMTAAANLTGSVVATYSLDPSLRGRRKVSFRDIPGVQVVPSATGVWKYYNNNTPPGEGSFGNQTIGSAKAQIDYDFTEVTVTVNTMAGFSRIAKQMMRDLPFMQNFLPNELREDYLRSESNSFINSLMAGTGAYTTTATVYAEKCIEWIAAVMARDYDPTAIVTTAANWATLLTTKPSDYSIPGGVTISAMGDVQIAGVPVVVSNNMTTGKTFVGDFSRVKIIQSSPLAVEFFEQDADNVTKNLVTVRAEADVALAVLRSDWGIYA
jgi:HK97 family phage major capsid protein